MTAKETEEVICFHLFSLSRLLFKKVSLNFIIVEKKTRFWHYVSCELADLSLSEIGLKLIVNTVLFVVLEHLIHRQSIHVDFFKFLDNKFVQIGTWRNVLYFVEED